MPEIDDKASDAPEVAVSGHGASVPSKRTCLHSAMSWTWKSSKGLAEEEQVKTEQAARRRIKIRARAAETPGRCWTRSRD